MILLKAYFSPSKHIKHSCWKSTFVYSVGWGRGSKNTGAMICAYLVLQRFLKCYASFTKHHWSQSWEWVDLKTTKNVTLSIFSPSLLLSCTNCIQASLSLNCLKLIIPGYYHNCLPVSCGDTGFLKKNLGLVLAQKSGLKVPFLVLRRSCPLQTILLSDLVGCDSPLQIVMAFWRFHHYCQPRAVTPDPESLNSNKKGAKLSLLSAKGCHARLDGNIALW